MIKSKWLTSNETARKTPFKQLECVQERRPRIPLIKQKISRSVVVVSLTSWLVQGVSTWIVSKVLMRQEHPVGRSMKPLTSYWRKSSITAENNRFLIVYLHPMDWVMSFHLIILKWITGETPFTTDWHFGTGTPQSFSREGLMTFGRTQELRN